MLKTLKKHRQVGFTIVELLIVIVVIGILAAIVLNTFSGVQARARNTERQTDMKSVSSQLEVFASSPDNTRPGEYITYTRMSTTANVTADLKGIDVNALQAPGGAANSFVNNITPTTIQYGYVAYTTSAGTTACASTDALPCVRYILAWQEEAVGSTAASTKTKNSLNGQP